MGCETLSLGECFAIFRSTVLFVRVQRSKYHLTMKEFEYCFGFVFSKLR
jgi:hypothetical protein